jgi:DNA-binding transcriptional regulator YdaS (Cro superfamily)
MARSQRKKPPVRLRRTSVAWRFEWTEELVALLGVLPDTAVAAQAGLDRQAVAAERRRRGIPPARPRRSATAWTEEMLALLGTDSDAAVARKFGIRPGSVTYKRHQLGIPPFNPPPHDQYRRFAWQPEYLAMLGKVSDRELAKALGLARASVTRKRQRLGIPPFQPALRPIEWTLEMIGRLGRASDAKVAQELGISPTTVKQKRRALGIPATRETLPVERSAEVAALLHLSNTEVRKRTDLNWATIQRLRAELGIEEPSLPTPKASSIPARDGDGSTVGSRAADPEGPAPPAGAWRSSYRWRPEEIELLGTAPDSELAARLGRSAHAVKMKRRELAIPAFPGTARQRWTVAEDALVGTASDAEVARRIGRSVDAVARRRRRVLHRKSDGRRRR